MVKDPAVRVLEESTLNGFDALLVVARIGDAQVGEEADVCRVVPSTVSQARTACRIPYQCSHPQRPRNCQAQNAECPVHQTPTECPYRSGHEPAEMVRLECSAVATGWDARALGVAGRPALPSNTTTARLYCVGEPTGGGRSRDR